MKFSTYINDKKIELYFYEDGHKVSDFSLTQDEVLALITKLMIAICRYDGCKAVNIKVSKLEKED